MIQPLNSVAVEERNAFCGTHSNHFISGRRAIRCVTKLQCVYRASAVCEDVRLADGRCESGQEDAGWTRVGSLLKMGLRGNLVHANSTPGDTQRSYSIDTHSPKTCVTPTDPHSSKGLVFLTNLLCGGKSLLRSWWSISRWRNFLQPEVSLPCSQNAVSKSYLSPYKSSPHSYISACLQFVTATPKTDKNKG
jgi:hypothetical protein